MESFFNKFLFWSPVAAIVLFLLCITVAIGIKKKGSPVIWGIITFGAAISNLILTFAMAKNSKSFFNDLLSFHEQFKNFEHIEKNNIYAVSRWLHAILGILFSTIIPLCFSVFALSFFKGIGHRIRLFLSGNNKELYIFSDLNERTLHLAKDIKSHKENEKSKIKFLIIFCNGSSKNGDLKNQAYEQDFLLIDKPETSFVKNSKQKRYFFALCDDENRNFEIAQELIGAYQKIMPDVQESKDDFTNVKIFVQNEELFPVLAMDSRPEKTKQITVIFVNKSETAANELLFNYPLFNVFKNQEDKKEKHIEMLIVGTTPCADKILKLALSVSQMGDGYSAKFIVADKNATKYREQLLLEAPEMLLDEYKIEFRDIDIETSSFKTFLDKECKDVNYVAVCAGDDKINFSTAIFLRSYFIRREPSKMYKPFIGVYLQNSERKDIDSLCQKKEKYDLYSFGNNKDIFSYKLLVNSELENLAQNIHAAYSCEYGNTKDELIQEYNRSETNRKSNRANAVHIKYKLYTLGFEIELKQDKETELQETLVKELKKNLDNKATIDKLARIEHLRWNAHERSDGWVTVSKEDSLMHLNKFDDHKFKTEKMHPCLCPWEDLDELSEYLNKDSKDKKDFKKSDIQICKALPKILGLVENEDINISGVKYELLKKR